MYGRSTQAPANHQNVTSAVRVRVHTTYSTWPPDRRDHDTLTDDVSIYTTADMSVDRVRA